MEYVTFTNEDGLLGSPFYRVAARAIIRDDQQRVLVVENDGHKYELPGGGWEHDETFEATVRREVEEELGTKVADVGDVWFVYRGAPDTWNFWMLRVVVPVKLVSNDFVFSGKDMLSARFVDREDFLQLPWCSEDAPVRDYVDKLWPPVEKAGETS